MSAIGFNAVEQGMQFLLQRSAVLATDVADAAIPKFVAQDIQPVVRAGPAGLSIAAVRKEVSSSASGALEYAMAATAKNSVRYRALADQERAMLKELRTVVDEARR